VTVLVRLFGEVEVNVDARRLDVGHRRQQCALVGLLVDAGHAVPLDRLQERVWGDRAPARAVERQLRCPVCHATNVIRNPTGRASA
jgi:DNA-binding SARP family transcriptional activator